MSCRVGSPRSFQGAPCRFRLCRSLPACPSGLARWTPSQQALAVAGHLAIPLPQSES